MNTHKKSASGLGRNGAAYLRNLSANDAPEGHPVLKWQCILASFASGTSWHALEAGRDLHAPCIHSDVACLEAHGLRFHRERITVVEYCGEKASVVRYSLLPESFPHACALLGVATPSVEPQGDDARAFHRASGGCVW